MKKLSSLLLMLSLGFMSQAHAASLFKDYQFGAAYSEFTEEQGYYDCSNDLGAKALCLDEVAFVGHTFDAALMFAGQDLVSVSLFSDFESDLLAKVVGALVKNFSLVAMQG